jgi:hypothetical protein
MVTAPVMFSIREVTGVCKVVRVMGVAIIAMGSVGAEVVDADAEAGAFADGRTV